jgi:hypothetical protein
MQRMRVVQQYVTTANNGGLKTEYEALSSRKTLSDKYEFIPVVLNDCHCGISFSDIRFYRRAISKAAPDIVHIRGAGIESLNAVIGAKLSGQRKILVTVHGMFSDLVYYSPIKRWICRHVIEPMIFELSDGISCVYEQASQRDTKRKCSRLCIIVCQSITIAVQKKSVRCARNLTFRVMQESVSMSAGSRRKKACLT